MRFFTTLAIALSGISVANAVSAPAVDNTDIIMRGEIAAEPLDHALEKRRGGGRSGGFSGGKDERPCDEVLSAMMAN